MDTERLETFLQVYRRGSVTHAARAVYRTQPSVTYQIQALERELGVALFERKGPRLIATPQAAILAEHASSLLGEFQRLKVRFEQIQNAESGALRIASSHTVTTTLLWRAVARFRRHFSGVTLTIKNGPTDEIIQLVREGRVNVGITSVAVKDGLLECLPLLQYGYWLVRGRAGSDTGFILPSPGSSLRRRVETALGVGERVVAEVASLEAVPDLVKSGVGLAILPGYALPRNRKGLRLKRLAHMGTDAVCSLCLKSDFRYPAASKFLALVQQSFAASSKS
jgi:DNA-binding transcriptional LysR family regulator